MISALVGKHNDMKNLVKSLLRNCGIVISRIPRNRVRGLGLPEDLALLICTPAPICFDVGANVGQTISILKNSLMVPQIHAFEPATDAFAKLNGIFSKDHSIKLYQVAMGMQCGEADFNLFGDSALNSLLDLTEDAENIFEGSRLIGSERVRIETIDRFSKEAGITSIDLLKIDTQGFDLNVLRGAERMLRYGSIQNVLIEINFTSLYDGQNSAEDIIVYLRQFKLHLVDFYEKQRIGNRIAWCTALFTKGVTTSRDA